MPTPDPLLCAHMWTANTGHGGEPVYRPGILSEPAMHVRCDRCGARTWVTEDMWAAMPVHGSPITDRDPGDETEGP